MPITGLIPQIGLPSEPLGSIPGEVQGILSKILEGKLAQQKNAREQELLPLNKEHLQSEINQQNALSEWYKRRPATGNGGGGVDLKNQMALMQQVIKDYPGTTLEQANAISSAWINGDDTLPDGSPVPKKSGNASYLLDAIGKRRTTAPIITQGVQANQAEAEMPVLKKYIDEGVKPYGTTIFGASPLQIKDALNVGNKDAQKRLGNYLASQQLLYDRAALMLKMNGLPPGVTIADEARKLAFQTINAKFPTLSGEARRIASEKVAKALTEALEARRKVPTGASSVTSRNKKSSSEKNVKKWVFQDGKLVEA